MPHFVAEFANYLKLFANFLTTPWLFVTLAIVLFFASLKYYRVWTRPRPAGAIALACVLLFLVSVTDHNFRKIVTQPDNVPIMAMLYIVGFFYWLSLRQAAINDERIEAGKGPREQDETNDRVHVWPDLVYIEFIAAILATVVLTVWSILLKAPLEQPASLTRTPNPSKAPWYFLGLQEMLVYFDPWLAGVVLPTLIIVGLVAIPYIDRNPKGAGYYTLKERPFAIGGFLFGFLVLWVLLVFNGTILRGPNWNFFGPFEEWDVHKLVPLTNVNLSEVVFIQWLGTGLPKEWYIREMPGILLVIGYLVVLPPILARTLFKSMYPRMGFLRYHVMIMLLLIEFSMLIKMYLRWTVNLKYVIAIPEYFFNI
ncbi:MAG: hypothetical protein HZA54_15950 [Planctomycetes bacterium]|nr:hypothetical protein [Planctomycetota bacterium]